MLRGENLKNSESESYRGRKPALNGKSDKINIKNDIQIEFSKRNVRLNIKNNESTNLNHHRFGKLEDSMGRCHFRSES